jgi:hypothetical protein
MTWLLIAGGLMVTTAPQQTIPELINHTLLGETIPAKEVVCRNRWGTPMPPDGKGGYSLIAPLNDEYIARSLIQPPYSYMPAFRPTIDVEVVAVEPATR